MCSDGEELHDNLPQLQKFMQENSIMRANLGLEERSVVAEDGANA